MYIVAPYLVVLFNIPPYDLTLGTVVTYTSRPSFISDNKLNSNNSLSSLYSWPRDSLSRYSNRIDRYNNNFNKSSNSKLN